MKKFRYSLARRFVQIVLLLLFALPAAGFILRGDYSASVLFDTVVLAEPFSALELFLASGELTLKIFFGALLIAALYALLGRVFCSWVCPVNIISDLANFLREKLGIKSVLVLKKSARYYILLGVLLFAFFSKIALYQHFAHYSLLARGIIYAHTSALGLMILLFIIELKSKNFICGHFCPLGAFYAILGRFALLKIIYDKSACTACAKCLKICPEAQVLSIINKHSGSVKSGECLRCGACIQACESGALEFNLIKLVKEKNEKTNLF